jgi:biopolymer transport protein ExbB
MFTSLAHAEATHLSALLAAAQPPATTAAPEFPPVTLLGNGGWMFGLILVASAIAIAVFIERILHYHREHINTLEFLNGVRTVLKRDRVVEAISICDATPGPVPRLVKTAILARDQGRERVREAIDDAGLVEVPRLEEKLTILATIAQIAPILGLLGTVLGFMKVFERMQKDGLHANVGQLMQGIGQALICAGAGLAVAAVAYAGYNYLVARVNDIVLDMEKCATEIVNMVTEPVNGKKA